MRDYANCFVKVNRADSTHLYDYSVLLMELIAKLGMFLILSEQKQKTFPVCKCGAESVMMSLKKNLPLYTRKGSRKAVGIIHHGQTHLPLGAVLAAVR